MEKKLPSVSDMSNWLTKFQADINKHLAEISAFPTPYLQQLQDEIDRESKKGAKGEDLYS